MKPIQKIEPLTARERQKLEECVRTIQALPDRLRETVMAYRIIREDRLYREKHKSFEAFCRDVLGVTASRVRQLMLANTVTHELERHAKPDSKSVTRVTLLPETEFQVRPLAAIPTAQQPIAWQRAIDRSGGRQPSAGAVRAVVAEMKGGAVDPNRVVHFSGQISESRESVRKAIALLRAISSPSENITAAIDLLSRDVDGGGSSKSKTHIAS